MSDLTPNHKAGEPLTPINGDNLQAMANKNTENPEGGKKVIRTHTEADGQFRNYTQVRDLEPTLVAEPPKLLGDDSAPNPTEIAQAGLAACISVGIQAIATHRNITLTKTPARVFPTFVSRWISMVILNARPSRKSSQTLSSGPQWSTPTPAQPT